MFSMIDKPGRASTSTSRPSLSITTSLTMESLDALAARGRDYSRRSAAVAARGSARVVRIETAAAIASAVALLRRMACGRFRLGFIHGELFRGALLRALGIGALLGGLARQ